MRTLQVRDKPTTLARALSEIGQQFSFWLSTNTCPISLRLTEGLDEFCLPGESQMSRLINNRQAVSFYGFPPERNSDSSIPCPSRIASSPRFAVTAKPCPTGD
jgi:hypothetical protein